MNLAALILSSDTKEDLIRPCLDSVINQIDCIVFGHIPLREGETKDNTSAIIHEVAHKFKISVIQIELEHEPITVWRNELLSLGKMLGCEWGMQLDTDEQMLWNGIDIKKSLNLQPSEIECLLVYSYCGNYEKPRFFKLNGYKNDSDRFSSRPKMVQTENDSDQNLIQTDFDSDRFSYSGKYSGAHKTHEDYVCGHGKIKARLPRVRFVEKDKTPEQARARLKHDLSALKTQIEMEPANPRWAQYYADALVIDGQHDLAGIWYAQAAALAQIAGSPEGRTWAIICHARTLMDLRQVDEAHILIDDESLLDWPEVHCLRGQMAITRGDHECAIQHAEAAMRHQPGGIPAICQPSGHARGGPIIASTHWDLPWCILAMACIEMGIRHMADWANHQAQTMSSRRLIWDRTGYLP